MHGARRLTSPQHATDGDLSAGFEAWESNELWPSMRKVFGIRNALASDHNGLSVEICETVPLQACAAAVTSHRELGKCGRELEISLPDGISYRTGEHVAFHGKNSEEDVKKAMKRFNLDTNSIIKISSDVPTLLPTDRAIYARQLLTSHLDLAVPATKQVCN
jgi:cytochrome P450/NADPH-cytochrome P450 reductase